MTTCESCSKAVSDSDRRFCASCSCVEHKWCAEAYGWKQDEQGEWLCPACAESAAEAVAVWFIYDRMGGRRVERPYLTREDAEAACASIDAVLDEPRGHHAREFTARHGGVR
jgi:hypothetical protein